MDNLYTEEDKQSAEMCGHEKPIESNQLPNKGECRLCSWIMDLKIVLSKFIVFIIISLYSLL